MTRTTTLIAAAFASAFLFAGAASAQPAERAQRQFQRQPPAPAQTFRNQTRDFAVTDALNRGPRFTVEAVNFKAVDESGRDIPWTSDEVFATYSAGNTFMMTRTMGDVDTGETRDFPANQTCIWPAVDPDGRENGRWSCAEGGGRGPITFEIELFDEDHHLIHGFCVGGRTDDDLTVCPQDDHTLLFRHTFTYDVSTLVQRTSGSCRCFVETARQSVDSLTTYELRFRITRVDDGSPEFAIGLPPPPPTPVVRASGTLTAPLLRGFEFDAGNVVLSGADFTFSRTGVGNSTQLTPGGGAKIWVGGAAARGYSACYAARNSASYVTSAAPTPIVGQYACYVTSDGRVGEFRTTALGNSLSVDYTTWQ